MIIDVFYRVYRGYFLWRKLVNKNKIDLQQDFIIIIPEGEDDISRYSLECLNDLIKKFELEKNKKYKQNIDVIRRNECFYVITDDVKILNFAKSACRRITKIITISQNELRMIIESYCTFPYSDRIILATSRCIQGRGGISALSSVGVDEKKIIAQGIFGLNEFEH